ncbi:MAG: thymidylate kinase [Ruminococcaceae bacterium]|nr:thymidylate kinase [Oscillospiraceae bacterium]
MSFFLAIDGLDGSGKETQSLLLKEALEKRGQSVRMLSFPDYESDSSFLVRMYLSGKLGDDPKATNAYAASTFFACDRYVSFRTDWQRDYQTPGKILIANRYTTANAVHQLSKLPRGEWDSFLDWLWEYEYEKLGIPAPDRVIYLELKPELSMKLIQSRCEKTGVSKDIHEKDPDHLKRSYEAALYASEKWEWTRIRCYEGDAIRSREQIHKEIMDKLGYDRPMPSLTLD